MARMDRRTFTASTAAGALLAAAGPPFGGARAAPPAAGDGRERLSAALLRHVASGEVPGYVAYVSRETSAIGEGKGVADLDTRQKMASDTLFRIASMTKPVCAAAVMILVQDGKLALDEPVDAHLPELARRRVIRRDDGPLDDTVPAKRAITVRDLLSFRLGYGAIMKPPGSTPLQQAMDAAGVSPGPTPIQVTPDEYLKRLGALPLQHQPGEGWRYHIGAEVAGILVARVAGKSFGDFIAERICGPLGMVDTGFVVPPEKLSRLSTAYRPAADGKLEAWDRPASSYFARPPIFAGGGGQMGLVSTADDFMRFARMLADGGGKILARASLAEMTRDQLTAAQKRVSPFVPGFWKDNGWGLGMAVNTRTGRYGWTGGFGCMFFVDPGDRRAALLLTQRMMTSPALPPIMADFEALAGKAI